LRGHLLCIPCTVRTAFDIAVRSTEDPSLRYRVLLETLRWLSGIEDVSSYTPAELHTKVCRIARRVTGNPDPFRDVKELSNRVAMRVVSQLYERINRLDSVEEKFRLAVLGSICGNTIDFEVEGYKPSLESLEVSLLRCLDGSFAVDDSGRLLRLLSEGGKVLYLLDNAGEIVFDKVLIELIVEHFDVDLWAVVKDGPVLNDATERDAVQVGLTEIPNVNVITTGNDHIGLKMEGTSDVFRSLLKEADLVIAKGQGYFESIPEVDHGIRSPICFVLRTKCKLVAEELNAPLQSNVVWIKEK